MEHDEAIKNFCDIANCDAERAKFFLSAANWELEAALNAFYLDPAPELDAETPPVQENPPVSQPQPTPKPVPARSNFGTISGLRKNDDDSEDENNDYYAGGSEHSGQVIRGNPSDKIKTKDVFDAAKKHGAEVVPDYDAPKPRSDAAFGGSGFRLGDQSSTHKSVPVVNNRVSNAPDLHSTITFWSNGFTVDDGPLRKMDDPANKDFLGSVMRGEIPQELVRQARGGEVHVKMVDKRTEEYAPPKPIVRPFSGTGFKLGSPTPRLSNETNVSKSPTNPPSSPSVKLDDSVPITNLQIRLADGTRLVAKFNHSHTISDVRNFINLSRPGNHTNYNLMTTFPNKVIDNEMETLQQAGLLNAVIVQRRI